MESVTDYGPSLCVSEWANELQQLIIADGGRTVPTLGCRRIYGAIWTAESVFRLVRPRRMFYATAGSHSAGSLGPPESLSAIGS